MSKINKKTVRLGIIGTGRMADYHAEKFQAIKNCQIVAAVDVDPARAEAFCKKHDIPASYPSLQELLARGELDAVSNVTPDAFHAPLSLQCLKAGKHVLCEKPLALNYPDARRMVAAARKAGLINMINFSYRDWPCIQAVAALVQRGGLGELRHIEASYLQSWLPSKIWGDWRTMPTWLWRLSSVHGSKGALGDVGVHIIDFATYPAGHITSVYCRLKAFRKAPRDRVGEYVLDANDSAVLSIEFKNGALGTIHTTRWAGGHINRLYLKISGTKGSIEIDSERTTDGYRLSVGKDLDTGLWKEVNCPLVPNIYARFVKSVLTGNQDQPDFARGAEVQKIVDACFKSDTEQRPVRV
jgi:predicted dehydrogenase